MRALRIAWLGFIRRGWGLVPIFLSTALLFGLVTLLITLEQTMSQWKQSIDDRVERLGNKSGKWGKADLDKISRVPSVVEVAPVISLRCKDWHDTELNVCAGVNDVYARVFNYTMETTPDVLARWAQTKNGAIVGGEVARTNGWHEGQTITIKAQAGRDRRNPAIDVQATIVYIAPKGTVGGLWLHHEYVDALLGNPGLYYPLWVVVDKASNRAGVVHAIEAMYESTPTPLVGQTLEAAKLSILGVSKLVISIMRATGVLAIVLLVFTSLTLLTLAIDSQRRELATLLAIGCRKGVLAMIIVTQSILLLAPGAAVGGALTYAAFHTSRLRFSDFFALTVSPEAAVFAGVLGIVLGAVVALLPARNAVRTNVLMTLRGE